MISVPGFLLRRLYVKGSLKNSQDGVTFELKNSLGSGYAKELAPIEIDGKVIAKEGCFFLQEGKKIFFGEVSEQVPFTLALNKNITIGVRAQNLEPGQHKVQMGFVVVCLGKLTFDFTDKVDASKPS